MLWYTAKFVTFHFIYIKTLQFQHTFQQCDMSRWNNSIQYAYGSENVITKH